MLIFNCSKTFAEFIEPKAKPGESPLVGPAPTPEQEAEFLQGSDSTTTKALQWTAHMVRVRRKPCVVVMEAQTRYAMVFTDLKKGDPQGFIEDAIVRLANEMTFAANAFDVMAEFQSMTSQFMAHHGKFAFFQRSDRSVMGHLKEVVWNLEDYAAETQSLPEGHEECAIIDEYSNNTLRSTKERKSYFVPAEEMLICWLKHYAGLTAQGEIRLREKIRERKRQAFQEQMATLDDASD